MVKDSDGSSPMVQREVVVVHRCKVRCSIHVPCIFNVHSFIDIYNLPNLSYAYIPL